MSKQPLPENSVPFTDILGYDGYMQTEGTVWQKRVYHAVTDRGTFPIAESFGFEGPQDFSADLDNKGWKELAANVQYGGDGHRNMFVYQRRGTVSGKAFWTSVTCRTTTTGAPTPSRRSTTRRKGCSGCGTPRRERRTMLFWRPGAWGGSGSPPMCPDTPSCTPACFRV